MNLVRQLAEGHWREFVNDHPEGNIFHTPEMFRVFAETRGYQPELWAIVSQNNQPLALLLPVKITIMEGWMRSLTTRAVVFGSVLSAHGIEGQTAVEKLLQIYRREAEKSVLYTELRNLSDLGNVQPVLENNGFCYEEHLNYLIDLKRPVDNLMESFGRRTRKNIRRGLRQNKVTIEEVRNPEQVMICYELIAKSYANARVPLADGSLFKSAFNLLYPKGMVKFLMARVDDVYVAASAELIYKNLIFGWYSGCDREYGQWIPNELLMWHILSWGAENGYSIYDFGGAGKPDEEYSVRDFKAKFKGELVNFGRNVYIHSPVRLTFSKVGYQLYRLFLRSKELGNGK